MKNKSKFKKNISFNILSKFFATVFIYIASILLTLFIGLIICTEITWQPYNPLYAILSFIGNNIDLTLILVIGTGTLVIFLYYWKKTLDYLQTVVSVTENIFDDNHALIMLPSELKDFENQLNQIKFNVKESKRAAKEAEQRKNDLVVYLAHDLKTPLTSVIGYLTLLRDENKISEELREKYLSISLEKAERLEDLINEFFEITRYNLSGITLEPSRVNLNRLLEQLVFEFKPMLAEKNLQCNINCEPDLELKCDVDKMQRVFDNLLRNAVNYSFESSEILIDVAADKDITISFTNKGNTIPPEKLSRIFEQFYRLDNARATKNGGAGIGLAIAKEIIELHKGSITAKSEDEQIIFEITIPSM